MVQDILTDLNISKASGPDGINNKILKECSYSLSFPLAIIFQKSIDLGYFPTSWKEAMVSAIFKKNDRQDKTNYRPISLLTCMSKVFERIVFNSLYKFLVDNKLLNSYNSGFRKNDSTINRLTALIHSLHEGLDDKKDMILILLDISKAFDKVWHPGLLFKLKQLGISQNLYNWFESYLTNRSQKVVVGGKSSPISYIQAGVPQGSILGPLLFLIFINDMAEDISLECHQYADDTTLVHKFENPDLACTYINNQLSKLSKWADQWRVTFNPSKTHFMLITNKPKRPTLQPIFLNNIIISEVASHCNLGLHINNRLTWDDHVNSVITKASKRLNVISRYKTKLPRLVLETLYLTMVRPVVEYGNVLYDSMSLSLGQSLEKLQRRAAIICTGAYKHTETQTLLQEVGWPSLSSRREQHKQILFYKIKTGIYPRYLQDLIPVPVPNRYPIRDIGHIPNIHTRLVSTAKSYIPSTIKLWNKLPATTVNAPTVSAFKKLLIGVPVTRTAYNTNCTGRAGKWLSRLRMGLSALGEHRFKYNLIDDASCPSCGQRETLSHYLFDCQTYAASRTEFYDSLTQLNLDTNNKQQLLNTILHGNTTNDADLLKCIFKYMRDSQRFV